MIRRDFIETKGPIAVMRQCEIVGVCRATVYAQKEAQLVDETDLRIQSLIDEEYTRHPFYGTRRMVVYLGRRGFVVNRKRVQRLMREMGLAGMAPGPQTSRPHPDHKIFPYLLRGVAVSGQTRFGVRTSRTSAWRMALRIWLRSWTGIAGRFFHGGSATAWMRCFVRIVLKKRC